MSRRRTIGWGLVCLAGILIASAIIVAWQRRHPPLPALVAYPNLPVQFNRALKKAHEAALAHGYNVEDVRELAHLYQANRLFAQARESYRVIAAGSTGLAAPDHYYIAAIDLDESDLEAAQVELQATLRAEPGYLPARLELADALFKGGQPDEAGKEYAVILGTEANHPQASFGMARVELQQGKEDAAVTRLKELIMRHPDSTSGAALLAQILDRRGDTDGAASMRELSRQNHEPVPSDPWTRSLQADCYDLQRLGMTFEEYRLDGQMDEALPLLGRLEELDPEGWIPPMLHGWSEKEAGHYAEAVRQYRLALARGGDPERICPLLVAALLTEGDAKEAAAVLADYHSKLPHSLPILRSYCEVAVRMKDNMLARNLLTEALKEDPYLYMANMSLFQILWNAGEHDAASVCLQRVVKVFPNDVDSRGFLGQYFMEKSDPWSAIQPLEQAVGIVPATDARRNRLTQMLDTAYLAAGSLEASRGQFPKALDYSEKSIRLVPDGLRGYALKANVCRRTKDLRGAEQALAKMVTLDPEEPTIQLTLGDVLYQGGDRDRAREHWQKALQTAPESASELRSAINLRLSGKFPAEVLH